ncbi:MAG: cytochrome c maturation protein CcmE [Rhodothermales bacterium]|nr:cytochrome c maturation protein CcmE [Rhodothermales bacterium]
MKPKTILGIVLLVGFTSLLLMNFGSQVGGYMTFEEAEEADSRAHVVGTWVEDQAMSYSADSNLLTFYMADEAGTVRKIQYANPKPANFEDAEKLVIEGHSLENEIFVAEHILVKCPSKYNAEAPEVGSPETADAAPAG